MWNNEDEDRNESGDDDESGTNVMNDNYRGNRNQVKQHLHNISLPCILYSRKDIEEVSDKHKEARSTPERTFHIEISQENDVDSFDQGNDIAVVCRPSQEQGFGLMTDEHIAHAVGAIQGSDAQKMGFMVKVIKGIEDTLDVLDTRIQERFDGAENQMNSSMSQFNQGVRKLREVIERVDETCSKIAAKDIGETKDDETQTDILPAHSNKASCQNKLFHRNSTQEFTLCEKETEYSDGIDIETIQTVEEIDGKSKSFDADLKEKHIFSISDSGDELVTSKEDMYEVADDQYFGIESLKQPTGNEPVFNWKIEPTAWLDCVRDRDEQLADDLLKKRKLPDKELLDKAYAVFGRSSRVVSTVCSSICSYLREKSSKKVIDIWPAYEYNKLSAETSTNRITFVVIKGNQTELRLGDVYRTYEREACNCSSESSEINKLEYDSNNLASDDLADLTNCVNENSVSLMDKYNNLTMVSTSCKLSKGFNTSARSVQDKPCVVLYVHVKGLIPLQEEPFPDQIGQYPVDVREAAFKPLLGGRPNEYHEHLRMGCAIRNSKIGHLGNCLAGTLGGFLEHPHYGLCCITCAHVVCDDLYKFQHAQNGVRYWTENDQPIEVFQPASTGSPSFGHLVCAVYNRGGFGKSGVDVALIKIDSRHPIDGFFPDTEKGDQTGFSADKPMNYFTGNICDREKLNTGSVVIKYGCSTELTRGVFRLQCGAVRTSHPVGQHQGLSFLLHNQIEILSAGESTFAEEGDSGAFVFIEENEELSVIGLLEGGMGDGRYIVTPINDILKALDLPQDGIFKTFDKEPVPSSPSSGRLLTPQVTFRCSSPQLSRYAGTSRSDSAISMSMSITDESASILSLVEERLKSMDEDITQEVAKQASETKVELNESIDKKLASIKADLKQEIQQSHKVIERRLQDQTNVLQQLLDKFSPPQVTN